MSKPTTTSFYPGISGMSILHVGILGMGLSCSAKSSTDPKTDTPESTDSAATEPSSTPDDSGTPTAENPLSGVYTLTEVTCAGRPDEVSVDVTVTFDDDAYLEEWAFPGLECTMALSGTAQADETSLSIVDVELSCSEACATEGVPCHDEPCSSDQIYQYSWNGDELLLSFTQAGDEFTCGPCGDGVESTYTMLRVGDP